MRKRVPLLAVSVLAGSLLLLGICPWGISASFISSISSLPLQEHLQQTTGELIEPATLDTHYLRDSGTYHSFRFGLDSNNANMTRAISSTTFPTATSSINIRNHAFTTNIGSSWMAPPAANCASTLDQTVATDIFDATSCLYTGTAPVQVGVVDGAIEPKRVSVLRGKVLTRDLCPIAGVVIAVLNHDEFGSTKTQADGMFTMVVNGGDQLTVTYSKTSLLPMQRNIQTSWRDYAWLPDAVMTSIDSNVTTIDLNATEINVARGSSISDADGTRTATLVVPTGTTAALNDGTALTKFKVQVTEYSVSAGGPAAMPGELPPTSGYTYAVDYTATTTDPQGAVIDVRFNQPVFHYVENFVQSPVGTTGTFEKFAVGSLVPVGSYDKEKARWVASKNGIVIKINSITSDVRPRAHIEIDVSGNPASDSALAALGFTNAEREKLAELYKVGDELWRVPITHFSPWDCNWPYGPPSDAVAPNQSVPKDSSVEKPSCQDGSIIDCQNQALGESVDIVGTPFTLNYRSDRVPGRQTDYELQIPLSGPTVPASLKSIQLEIFIAGRKFSSEFRALPNQQTRFHWDGKDVLGRVMQGKQPITVRVGYDYQAEYQKPEPGEGVLLAFAAFGVESTGIRGRNSFTLWQQWKSSLGAWNALGQKVGGWDLSVHHLYDPDGKTVYFGDGRRRSADTSNFNVIETVAGNSVQNGPFVDGQPATATSIGLPKAIALARDGTLYIGTDSFIRRVDTKGIAHNFAGNTSLQAMDNVAPTLSKVIVSDFTLAIDGSIYVANEHYIRRIHRIAGVDNISLFAGSPETPGNPGGVPGEDDGFVLQATFRTIQGIAVAPDNTIYVADSGNNRIRRIGPDGVVSTIAGPGVTRGNTGDGSAAKDARIDVSGPIAVRDGSVYFLSRDVIRKIDPDGIIRPFASAGDLGIAPTKFSFAPDGTLYVAGAGNKTIRRRYTDGVVSTVAGNGTSGPLCTAMGDGGPSTQAQLSAVRDVALGPDGDFYIADFQNCRVRKVTPTLPGYADSFVIAAEDGTEIYIFDRSGRHLRTLNALTGAIRYEFGYDAAGLLTTVTEVVKDSITDPDNNVTTIERDTDGNANAIVSPFGQRTVLTKDANGYLESIKNPADEVVQFTYSVDGLLKTLTDALNNPPFTFEYDALGRLIKDTDPEGGFKTLARTEKPNSFSVLLKTKLDVGTTYEVQNDPNGDQKRVNTFPNGLHENTTIGQNGTTSTVFPGGMVTTSTVTGDPRFKMQSPLIANQTIKTPILNISAKIVRDRSATLSNPRNPLSLVTQRETLRINDTQLYTRDYAALTKTFTDQTPLGRKTTSTIDAQGRIVGQQFANLDAAVYHYDLRGRLDNATLGTGATARPFTFSYNSKVDPPVEGRLAGFLDTVKDPMTRVVSFRYDLAGRIKTQILPDSREIGFTYDANGNVSTISPPGRPAHIFHYTKINLLRDYTPPDVGNGAKPIVYHYNEDRRLDQITRADGSSLIKLGYEAVKGRLQTITTPATLTTPASTITYDYNDSTGNLKSITAPGATLSYTFDGVLLKDTVWTGPVLNNAVNPACCSVNRTYNNRFLLEDESVNNKAEFLVRFDYDNDNLPTKAGALTITPDPLNGLPTATAIGSVTDSRHYNSFGEIDNYSASFGNTPLLSIQYPDRDKLGRITKKVETIGGQTTTYLYGYDAVGRLMDVSEGSSNVHYDYDENSNRKPGNYNAQDQLKDAGGFTYEYTLDGELLTKTKTSTSEITRYVYDALGNLLSVTLPDDSKVEYTIDGQNRRIERKFNGAIKRFLYRDRLGLIAELNGNNEVVSRFVYGTRSNVPEYMIKDGKTYRLITDHLGSVRLVVDVNATSVAQAIAQRIDYDEFGNVPKDKDTNPGFQPFGFAGGIYDPDTGLVRFGARDYDGFAGRWTTKDPVGFESAQANLYSYGGGDPVNRIDPGGLWAFGFSFEFSTINPWTSGGGGSYGINVEYTSDSGWNLFTYGTPNDQSSEGFLIGPSFQINAATGNGDWSGPFKSVGGSFGPVCGGYFETANPGPGDPGYFGFSIGLGTGPPAGVGRTTTNYTEVPVPNPFYDPVEFWRPLFPNFPRR